MHADTTSDTKSTTSISSTIFDSRYVIVLYRPSLRSLQRHRGWVQSHPWTGLAAQRSG